MLSDSISDRTLALLFPNVIIYLLGIWIFHFSLFIFHLTCTNKTNVPADLHELLSAAKNLPECNIRIFNPLTSYFKFL